LWGWPSFLMTRSLTVVAVPVRAEGFARQVSEVVPLALRAVAPRIAVPVPIAGATLAVTVAVTMVIRWRGAAVAAGAAAVAGTGWGWGQPYYGGGYYGGHGYGGLGTGYYGAGGYPGYYGDYAHRSYVTGRPTLFPRYYGW